MKKVFLISLLLFITNVITTFAQETLQVRRIIDCMGKRGFHQEITSDSPNRRFMPIEGELQRYLMTWVWKGKLQAYHYTDKMADFSKKVSRATFRSKIIYFDTMFEDSIELRPTDLFEFALEEKVTYQNGKFQYNIQALVLYIPKMTTEYQIKGREPVARFRYKDVAELCEKTYQKSLQTQLYGGLECFLQVYHDNTQTISFAVALEKRYFNSQVETVIPATKKSILANEQEYSQKIAEQEGIIYLPHFTELANGTITTSITEEVDLKQETAFFKDDNTLIQALIEGVRIGEIKPYWFTATSRYAHAFRKKEGKYRHQNRYYSFKKGIMTLPEFEKQLREYKYRGDTIRKNNKVVTIKAIPIDSSDLKITQISMLDIQSIVEIKKGKSIKISPYRITMMLPKGTNPETKLGNMKLLSFKYEEVAKYLEKLAQKSDKYTFTTQSQGKITFAQAIEQRLFSSNTLQKYDNIFDHHIVSILADKYKGKIDNIKQRIKEEGQAVLAYIYSLGK